MITFDSGLAIAGILKQPGNQYDVMIKQAGPIQLYSTISTIAVMLSREPPSRAALTRASAMA